MTCVVYGVTRRREAPPVADGVAGAPVRLVSHGELSAAVSEAPAELLARRRDVAAHMDVLDALMRDGPVLPFRFGAVAADDAAVATMLADRAAEFTANLAALDDLVQITLHLSHDENAVVPLVMAVDERLRRYVRSQPRAGDLNSRIAVGEQVANAVARLCDVDQTMALERFAEIAEATAVTAQDPQNMVVSFLVRRDRLAEVDTAAAEIAETLTGRAHLEVAGPMPPYSFVE